MNKSDVIKKAASRSGLSRRAAARAVETTLEIIRREATEVSLILAGGGEPVGQALTPPAPVRAAGGGRRRKQDNIETAPGGEMAEKREEESGAGESASGQGAALGLDVGTSRIVLATGQAENIKTASELNAFISVPYSKFTEHVLKQNKVPYHRDGDASIMVYGNQAERFANVFNAEVRRPMMGGILNPVEEQSMPLIEALITQLLRKTKHNETVRFSIPGPPRDGGAPDLVYHEAMIKNLLAARGYHATAINEGLAVVFAEMGADNFSGIGISCGGGMCNVCLSFMSLPVITFSLGKAGDYIDQSVASVTGERATRVRTIKEESLDLSQPPKNKYENALHVYYDDVILSLVEALRAALVEGHHMPRIDRTIPIVLSGGTSKPKGFLDKFRQAIESDGFPLEISEIRMAEDPLTATARGCLIAALYDA